MEKQQHTPGPWRVNMDCEDAFLGKISVEAGNSYYIAQVDEGRSQLANARLIAAAPELLEALELLVDNPYREGTESDERLRRIARAAIANATGG